MTTNPDLTKLNFPDIKKSLTDFLKNQSVFVDYNFEGTVIQTLIDLLSYNTYYYAFYSNMITSELFLDTATRIESLTSLVKPLGYTIPGKKSSSTKIKYYLDGGDDLERYTPFTAINTNGVYYTFYNTDVAPLNNSIADQVDVTEGYQLVDSLDISSNFDYIKQRYILDEEDVDISTIRVEIKLNGEEDWSEWTNVNNFPNNDDNIFYIERMGTVFTIELGKYNNLGKSIESGDSIRISYLLSSGSDSNGLYQFSDTTVVDVYFPSVGGKDGPDINSIKFIAPKVFSGQERAVTTQDYVALLLKNNFINNTNQVAIYGGDEIYPPKYGRVFVSFLPFEGIANSQDIINYLREKNMLTVLPEYIIPTAVNVTFKSSAVFDNGISNNQQEIIKNNIIAKFNSINGGYVTDYLFNLAIDAQGEISTIGNGLRSRGLTSLTVNSILYEFTIKDTQVSEISLNYPIERSTTSVTICNPFILVSEEEESTQIVLRLPSPVSDNNAYIRLEAWQLNPDQTYSYRPDIDAGTINYQKGHILINKIYTVDELAISITSLYKNISELKSIASRIKLILE